MARITWKDAAEFIGVVAIVASLIFVGMQMRQDRVHARSELGAGSFDALANLRMATNNTTEFARTHAKMLMNPEDLSIEERLQINAYLDSFKFLIIRDCYLMQRGVFTECEVIVREYGEQYFGNRYAQSWWRLQKPESLTFLPDWVDATIRSFDTNSNMQQLDDVMNGL